MSKNLTTCNIINTLTGRETLAAIGAIVAKHEDPVFARFVREFQDPTADLNASWRSDWWDGATKADHALYFRIRNTWMYGPVGGAVNVPTGSRRMAELERRGRPSFVGAAKAFHDRLHKNGKVTWLLDTVSADAAMFMAEDLNDAIRGC